MKKNYIHPTYICVDLKGETICAESNFDLTSAQELSDAELDVKEQKSYGNKNLWDELW